MKYLFRFRIVMYKWSDEKLAHVNEEYFHVKDEFFHAHGNQGGLGGGARPQTRRRRARRLRMNAPAAVQPVDTPMLDAAAQDFCQNWAEGSAPHYDNSYDTVCKANWSVLSELFEMHPLRADPPDEFGRILGDPDEFWKRAHGELLTVLVDKYFFGEALSARIGQQGVSILQKYPTLVVPGQPGTLGHGWTTNPQVCGMHGEREASVTVERNTRRYCPFTAALMNWSMCKYREERQAPSDWGNYGKGRELMMLIMGSSLRRRMNLCGIAAPLIVFEHELVHAIGQWLCSQRVVDNPQGDWLADGLLGRLDNLPAIPYPAAPPSGAGPPLNICEGRNLLNAVRLGHAAPWHVQHGGGHGTWFMNFVWHAFKINCWTDGCIPGWARLRMAVGLMPSPQTVPSGCPSMYTMGLGPMRALNTLLTQQFQNPMDALLAPAQPGVDEDANACEAGAFARELQAEVAQAAALAPPVVALAPLPCHAARGAPRRFFGQPPL